MADDTKQGEDSFVALVLILGKLLKAEDSAAGRTNTEDIITRSLHLISKERKRILAARP